MASQLSCCSYLKAWRAEGLLAAHMEYYLLATHLPLPWPQGRDASSVTMLLSTVLGQTPRTHLPLVIHRAVRTLWLEAHSVIDFAGAESPACLPICHSLGSAVGLGQPSCQCVTALGVYCAGVQLSFQPVSFPHHQLLANDAKSVGPPIVSECVTVWDVNCAGALRLCF